MRHRFYGGALLAATALFVGSGVCRAQESSGFQYPLNADPQAPIPLGNPQQSGFYTAVEFLTFTQTRDIGNQTVAYRGLVDSSGRITGIPGTYIGSGATALTTNDFTRTTFQPGFRVELGYKFDSGLTVYGNYSQLFDAKYTAGATEATQYSRSNISLTDTFLTSAVFNFPPSFAGPVNKTGFDRADPNHTDPNDPQYNPGSNTYGIWNGASVMNITLIQRFTQAEIGGKMPIFQSDYSRVYALGGARYAWLFERFTWFTQDFDTAGNSGPQDVAFYTNTLSQRMYGPFVGVGHDIYLGNRFGLSLDLTGAALLDVIKERAKYKLESPGSGGVLSPVASKFSRDDYSIVPNANANINLMWYPIEGVQVKFGYTAQAYFNTRNMLDPIGFNYSTIDPVYATQVFRIVHGINVGVALFF